MRSRLTGQIQNFCLNNENVIEDLNRLQLHMRKEN